MSNLQYKRSRRAQTPPRSRKPKGIEEKTMEQAGQAVQEEEKQEEDAAWLERDGKATTTFSKKSS